MEDQRKKKIEEMRAVIEARVKELANCREVYEREGAKVFLKQYTSQRYDVANSIDPEEEEINNLRLEIVKREEEIKDLQDNYLQAVQEFARESASEH